MEVSSSSMKVASVTVSATAQGFTPGFTEVVCAIPVVCVAANYTPSSRWEVDSRRDRSVANGSIIFSCGGSTDTEIGSHSGQVFPQRGPDTAAHHCAVRAPFQPEGLRRMLDARDHGGSGGRKGRYLPALSKQRRARAGGV